MKEENTANLAGEEVKNEEVLKETETNLESTQSETQEEEDSIKTKDNVSEVSQEETQEEIDYRKKFSESSKEAQRLHEENKKLRQEAEEREQQAILAEVSRTENLYPGFEYLSDNERNSLTAYTNAITQRAVVQAENKLKNDPAYSFAMRQYSENRFNEALSKTIEKFPQLKDSKEDFKAKYYNPSNVPENLEEILGDLAKIYLFDNAKAIGEQEALAKVERVQLERGTSGQTPTPSVSRTLDDWNRMAQEDPVKFSKLSKEFHADLESGKI